jgi:hypothetical protein
MISTVMALALVTKVSGSGFVMPDWARSERCEVFADKVVTTRTFGGSDEDGRFTVRDVRRIHITAGISRILARAAAEAETSTPNDLCDAPSSSITAATEQGSFTLFNTGGCGSPRIERNGGASGMLIELANRYCAKDS